MERTKRQPKSRPATLRKREDILKAAIEIFGSKGYAGGTLAEIADHVGITHAGVLHHFGSKDNLLLEVLTYRDESDVADLDTKHIPDGAEFFEHLVRTAFLNAQRAGLVQAYAVLSAESVTDDHPARDYFVARYRTLRGEAEQALRVLAAERGVKETASIETPGAVAARPDAGRAGRGEQVRHRGHRGRSPEPLLTRGLNSWSARSRRVVGGKSADTCSGATTNGLECAAITHCA